MDVPANICRCTAKMVLSILLDHDSYSFLSIFIFFEQLLEIRRTTKCSVYGNCLSTTRLECNKDYDLKEKEENVFVKCGSKSVPVRLLSDL